MTAPLHVSFNSPQSGFMSIGLRAPAQEFVTVVAHAPYDSLCDLLDCLTALLTGASAGRVKWNCEPDELDFKFTATQAGLAFWVIHYADHRRARRGAQIVFGVEGPTLELCRAFAQAFVELDGRSIVDEFAANWRRAFPASAWRAFTDALAAQGAGGSQPPS